MADGERKFLAHGLAVIRNAAERRAHENRRVS
jgi:hypothetical protein